MIRPASVPLSLSCLALRFGLLLTIWFAALGIIEFIGLYLIRPATASNPTSQSSASNIVLALIAVGWTYVTIGYQAIRLGYRPIDLLFVLVPVYGLLVFVPRMLWRIAGLPNNHWGAARSPEIGVLRSEERVHPRGSRQPITHPTETRLRAPLKPSTGTFAAPPPIEPSASSAWPPTVSSSNQSGGRRLPGDSFALAAAGADRGIQRSWILGVVVAGVLVAFAFLLIATVGIGRHDPALSSLPASPKPPPTGLPAGGTLLVPSTSATVPSGSDVWSRALRETGSCVGVDRREAARRQAESARLSFSTDKQGSDLIGAVGIDAPAHLVLATVEGQPTCAWEVRFSTLLPAGTTVFFIQYGYSSYYWGPYSRFEASDIGLAYGGS